MEQNKQENRKTVTVDVAIKSNDYIHNRLKYELRKRAGNKEYEYISNSNNICVQIYIYIFIESQWHFNWLIRSYHLNAIKRNKRTQPTTDRYKK